MNTVLQKKHGWWNTVRLIMSVAALMTWQANAESPNVIVIMSDDGGYADIGFSGKRLDKANFATPHIDAIAGEGVIFDQAYVTASVCSPSRAGMLTGRYQQRFGHEYNLPVHPEPGDVARYSGLNINELTLADHLRAGGYTTGLIGKWHLGLAPQFHPNERGFDFFYGLLGGGRSYWENDQQDTDYRRIYRNQRAEPYRGYLTDRLGDEAIRFVHENKSQPFFLFLSHTAVHAPMEAKPQHLEAMAHIENKQRRTLAAMTLALDDSVGELMSTLDELSLRDNTLVIFLNDNGGPSDYNWSSNLPLMGVKGTLAEGGIRVPFTIRWPNKFKAGSSYHHPISALDIVPTVLAATGVAKQGELALDGVNLLPYLHEKQNNIPHPTLYWRRAAFAAIRHKDHKLIRFPDRPAVLYNMVADPFEAVDLAPQQPALVAQLMKKLFAWENQLQAPLFLTHTKWVKQNRERYSRYTNVDKDGVAVSLATKAVKLTTEKTSK